MSGSEKRDLGAWKVAEHNVVVYVSLTSWGLYYISLSPSLPLSQLSTEILLCPPIPLLMPRILASAPR